MKRTLITKLNVAILIITLTAPFYLVEAQRRGVNKLSRLFEISAVKPPKSFKVRKTPKIENLPKTKNPPSVKLPSRTTGWSVKQRFEIYSLNLKNASNKVKEALPVKSARNTTVATGRLKNKNYLTIVAAKKQNQQISALNNIKSKTTTGKIKTKGGAKQVEKQILSEITENSSPLLKKEAGYAVRRVREIEAAEIRLTQQKFSGNFQKTKAQNARNLPGTVSFGNKAVANTKGFGIPKSVVEKMLNRKYESWKNFRRALNREISKTPEAQKYFDTDNITELSKGNNPVASVKGQQGKRRRLEWDHYFEIRDGYSPYDLRNLRLVTPRTHINKIGRKFNLSTEIK